METGTGSNTIPALTGPPHDSGTCNKVHLPDLFNKSNSCSLFLLLSLVVIMTGCLNMLLLLWDWPGGLVFTLLLVTHLMVKTSELTGRRGVDGNSASWTGCGASGLQACPIDIDVMPQQHSPLSSPEVWGPENIDGSHILPHRLSSVLPNLSLVLQSSQTASFCAL